MTRKPSPVFSLLAVLLCYVLCATQAHALSGGPVYPGSNVRTTGIYAGVLNGLSSNSLGLFSASVTTQGVGTGRALVFKAGLFSSGTINVVADPDSGSLSGLLDLQYIYSYTVASSGNAVLVTLTVSGAGVVTGQISAPSSPFSATSARITGSALVTFTAPPDVTGITVDPLLLEPVNYTVLGFKQQDL